MQLGSSRGQMLIFGKEKGKRNGRKIFHEAGTNL